MPARRASAEAPPSGPLAIRYARLRDAALWDDNPKRHDVGGITQSIRAHGFRDAPIFDATLAAIVAGNGRATVLAMMREDGRQPDDATWPPEGVVEDAEGEWWIPLQVGIDAPSAELAEAFGIDHNVLTLAGSNLEAGQIAGLFDADRLAAILGRSRASVLGISQADIEKILNPPPPRDGKEFDEDAAQGVPMIACPACGHRMPK
jgi:hypothetical protein